MHDEDQRHSLADHVMIFKGTVNGIYLFMTSSPLSTHTITASVFSSCCQFVPVDTCMCTGATNAPEN